MAAPSAMTAEEWLLKAIQSEVAGNYEVAINYYSKAYQLKPALEFRKEVTLTVNGVKYDDCGVPIVDPKSLNIKSYHPKKFKADDKEALEYLDENGYVVIESVANESETKKAIELFWDHIELITKNKINRKDPETWNDKLWPSDFGTGIFFDEGIGQSEFLWFLRGLPKTKQAFATVWKDDDLLVSFDGCGAFRPPEYNRDWLTRGGWYHVDQNGKVKKGRHAVQGLVNLFPSGEGDGGLVVYPKTQKLFPLLFDEYAGRTAGDYYEISKNSKFWDEVKKEGIEAAKLCIGPGDLVLWDSRVIHCNTPPTVFPPCDKNVQLRRLVAYICMTPSEKLEDIKILKRRIEATKLGVTTNHWPHEWWPNSAYDFKQPVQLSEHQKGLVTGLKYMDLWEEEK